MKLRKFEISDAPIIFSWIEDKTAFRKWSADRYPVYPPKPEDMLAQYDETVYPFTAVDENDKVVGHFILRYFEPTKTILRLGFVIVDNSQRSKGLGKQMLHLAIQKAKDDFDAKKISLGVFDNNPSAYHCYQSIGFKTVESRVSIIDNEEWMAKEMIYDLTLQNSLWRQVYQEN